MDLQTEYIRRHKINVVVGTPDSYLFFKSGNNLYVATMTHRPRTTSHCKHCNNIKMALEIWTINSDGMGLIVHTHVGADEDIIDQIKNSCQFPNPIETIR